MQKKWYLSKTIWVALFTFVATVVANVTGFEIDPTLQAAFLSVIMIFLRLITKQPVEW